MLARAGHGIQFDFGSPHSSAKHNWILDGLYLRCTPKNTAKYNWMERQYYNAASDTTHKLIITAPIENLCARSQLFQSLIQYWNDTMADTNFKIATAHIGTSTMTEVSGLAARSS